MNIDDRGVHHRNEKIDQDDDGNDQVDSEQDHCKISLPFLGYFGTTKRINTSWIYKNDTNNVLKFGLVSQLLDFT